MAVGSDLSNRSTSSPGRIHLSRIESCFLSRLQEGALRFILEMHQKCFSFHSSLLLYTFSHVYRLLIPQVFLPIFISPLSTYLISSCAITCTCSSTISKDSKLIAMAAPTYYTYKDPFPATLNHPYAVQAESKADWPKSYRYNPNHTSMQGIHPPAPVYTANQPAPSSWYYHGNQVCAPIFSLRCTS